MLMTKNMRMVPVCVLMMVGMYNIGKTIENNTTPKRKLKMGPRREVINGKKVKAEMVRTMPCLDIHSSRLVAAVQ